MNAKFAEMTDLMFDLDGSSLPTAHPFVLWAALIRHAPQLAENKLIGVLPLRGATIGESLFLTKRSKLALRLPATLSDSIATRLTGQALDFEDSVLHLGSAKTRSIQPFPTIHAQHVTGNNDEVQFIANIHAQLDVMGIKGGIICGKRRVLQGNQQSIHGYSLVIHDLKPDASLRLQYSGLGENRQYGCGIFVPYKVITGLGDN